MPEYTFDAEVWRWQARTDGWFFVALPAGQSDATFVLPLKKAVRTEQGIGEGDVVTVHLILRGT